ncbi:MAG: UvrD-helicase domain-containing protein [Proteobacteria bacterium]|nr:UvrD-helicase domain-containing protein [Pseudomonadota bacterium]
MFIADLHIHSHLSRATARNLNLEHLNLWAQLKGIQVLGTGDFTHPQWFSELREKLESAEPGLFKLGPEFANEMEPQVFGSCQRPVRFMLSAEISCIYKKNGKTRKNHNVVFVPDFESAEKLNRALERIGNIRSDGRPILGLDARDLLETVLEVSPDAHLIPAHIWTPWFSLFGSKSGFDSIEECFGDLSRHIFAVETGLSSDPPMNWRFSALDELVLISNSDAHSPSNIGREANIFDTDLSYFSMFHALRSMDGGQFLGTIEFFPEEGKYHYDGHRKCNMRMSPKETLENKNLCPKCGRPVTIGVMHRVEELADRDDGLRPEGAASFRSLLSLAEILAQARGVGPRTNSVQVEYRRLVREYGPELSILMDLHLEDLEAKGDILVAEGIRRMRQRQIDIAAGYDGEFGSITLFTPEERQTLSGQENLGFFGGDSLGREKKQPKKSERSSRRKDPARTKLASDSSSVPVSRKGDVTPAEESGPVLRGLNPRQKEAVCHEKTPLLIVAGPGTGKTLTLTRRIEYLIYRGVARPEQVLAITFTNKAAEEMKHRLGARPGGGSRVTVETFHGLGYDILREERRLGGQSDGLVIIDETRAEELLREIVKGLESTVPRKKWGEFLGNISRAKQNLLGPECFEGSDPGFALAYRLYQEELQRLGGVDLDDLISLPVKLLENEPKVSGRYRERFRFISVDEYQDINFAQYRLIQQLSPHGENLCVIGDPDQAIYGFRGADSRYFLQFENDYPGAKIVCLERNYRSSETILQASTSLISQNKSSCERRIWSGISGDSFLSIGEYPTDKAEAESIVHTIEQLVGGTSHFSLDSGRVDTVQDSENRSFSDFAVFYRLHFQGEVLEGAFERSGIPFHRIGGEALAKNRRVREVFRVLQDDMEGGTILPTDKSQDRSVPWSGEMRGEGSLSERLRSIIEDLEFDSDDDVLRALVSEAETWTGDVGEFVARTAFKSDLDIFDLRAEKVTLMTLHGSKGLEFPIVFISGCEADLLPYRPDGRPPSPVEEERRLFYVGLTRGRERVFLTRARRRALFGRTKVQDPSPFLAEIENHLKELTTSPRRITQERMRTQLDLF